jgi:hypothetical protein
LFAAQKKYRLLAKVFHPSKDTGKRFEIAVESGDGFGSPVPVAHPKTNGIWKVLPKIISPPTVQSIPPSAVTK